MITEDVVNLETAKLLKEHGFKEWCHNCYALDVRHNGISIDSDEEFELRAEGRENEIELVDGGSFLNLWSNNDIDGVYAAPTLYMAMKWLREGHDKSIEIRSQGLKATSIGWIVEIYNLVNQDEEFHHPYTFPTYEEACEAAIQYCLEKLV